MDPAPFEGNWHFDALAEHLEQVAYGRIRKLLINEPPRFGKALGIDTPVLTTWGWKHHGDLRPGDFVFGPDGQPKRVIAVTPHHIQPSYDVGFDDGATITASEGHLWEIERDKAWALPRWHRSRSVKVVTTKELVAHVPGSKKTDVRPDRIPLAAPIEFPPRRLLIDPYLLGAWLGDGGSKTGCLHVGHEDIEHFKPLGYIGTVYAPNEFRKQPFYRITVTGLATSLTALGLMANKHIPQDYLEASVAQRWELLRGLMDTDGTCSKEGTCSFTNLNRALTDQVIALTCSLGLKPSLRSRYTTLNGKKFGPHHTVTFTPPRGVVVFNLARKQARVIGNQNARSRGRYVERVTPVGLKTVNCIQVEGELYLAGERFVTTHNSLMCSVAFPAWVWAKDPDPRYPLLGPQVTFMCLSYGDELALAHALVCKRLIQSQWYQERWGRKFRISDDKTSTSEFHTTRGGGRISGSFQGAVTGRGTDYKILDDPHKVQEAESKLARDKVTTDYDNTLKNRVTDPRTSAEIIVMQRTHETDLSGHVLSTDPDYVHLCLPAKFEAARHCLTYVDGKAFWADPRTVEGELLWPSRWGEKELAPFKANPYTWAGQYQQRPSPAGGGIIKREWWQLWGDEDDPNNEKPENARYRRRPVYTFKVGVLDTAYTAKQVNDPCAMCVWSVFMGPNDMPAVMLDDAWDERLLFPDLMAKVVDTARRRKIDVLLVEDKTAGPPLVQEMQRRYVKESWSVELVPVNRSTGDKIVRLNSVQPLFIAGMVWAPFKPWAERHITEVSMFPKATHDEYADLTSMGLRWLRDRGHLPLEREVKEEEEDRLKRRTGGRKQPLYPGAG